MVRKRESYFQKRIIVCVIALLCTALWGSAFPCIKIGYSLFAIDSADAASAILFAGIRFCGAGVLVILFGSIGQRRFLLPKRTSWGRILVLSVCQTIVQYLFFYLALAHTTAVKSSILEGAGTLFAILFACFLFRQESMTASKLSGIIVGFAGIVLVNLTGGGLTFEFALTGEGFMIISTVSSALSAVFLKIFSEKDAPVMLSGYQFLIGGAVLTAVGTALGGHLSSLPARGILLLIYMMLISAVAYSLWGILLKYNSVSRITIFGFMIQVFGSLFSALLLREAGSISAMTILALILVCGGIFLVNRESKAKA